jgi:hypothetical protein
LGEKNVEPYFTDPESPQGQQMAQAQANKPDPKMLEIQMKAEVEKLQAQADIATQQQKAQSEAQLAQLRFDLESKLKLSEHNMKMEEHRASMAGHVVKMATTRKTTGENGTSEQSVDQDVIDKVLDRIAPVHSSSGPKRKTIRNNKTGASYTVEEHA